MDAPEIGASKSGEAVAGMWAHCNRCSGDKRHTILSAEATSWVEQIDAGRYEIGGRDQYRMLRCNGCDAVQMLHHSWFYQNGEESGPEVKRYPPKVDRPSPRWTHTAEWAFWDSPVKALHAEIGRALAAQCPRLAAMGVRALIEAVMIDKVDDQGTFSANLDKLQSDGLLSQTQRKHLEQAIDSGSATIHRGYAPSTEEVHAALDIAENVIEALYITPERASVLQSKTPPHQKKKRVDPGIDSIK